MQSWDDFQLILALHRNGSLRATAAELGLNHSTVSRRLAGINGNEQSLIFIRSGGRYALTALGERLVKVAELMEQAVHLADRQKRAEPKGLSGKIRLSVPDFFGQYLLLDDLFTFCQTYPNIDLHVSTTYDYVDLERNEVDIVVRGADELPNNLTGERASRLAVSYYCKRGYLERTPPDERRWIRPADGGAFSWDLADSPFPDVPDILRVQDHTMRYMALLQGYGMGRAVCFMADVEPDLVRLPGAKTSFMQDIWVMTHADLARTPRINALVSWLVARLRGRQDLLEGQGLAVAP